MLKKTFKYFYQFYISPGFVKRKYVLPSHVNFPITDNCNSKCVMCNVWKDKSENELTAMEIRKIFSDKLFVKTKHLGISGGEPTLRKDLVDCIIAIVESIKELESLSITTHGFHPTKWKRLLPEIHTICKDRGINFSVNVSVDGIGKLHEEVRRVENGWKKVLETIKLVKENDITLQIQTTVSRYNVFGVNEILHYAKKEKLDVVFRKATTIERLYNQKITEDFFTNSQENSFFSDFLQSNSLNSYTKNPARRLFYRDLSKRLIKKTSRQAPCHFQYNGVLISAHGEMFHCSIDNQLLGSCRNESPFDIYFRKENIDKLNTLIEEVCPSCLHDQSGSWEPFKLIKEEFVLRVKFLKTAERVLKFATQNILHSLGVPFKKVQIVPSSSASAGRAHIIGAYGGEHVGDSAILAGVILRILKKNPDIQDFIVYSKRPDRTKFWVKGLDFNNEKLNITVRDSKELTDLKAYKNDFLVWAGGPIMEMPLDLLSHYTTIKAFKKADLPFEVIGCGWGPFKTIYTKKLALKILKSASSVQMRDMYDLHGIPHMVDKDPAFDYLNQDFDFKNGWSLNLSQSLSFLKNIRDLGYKKLLLLNLRPMWSKYNKSDLTIEQLHELIHENIISIILALPKDTAVISVPFNTDHYGFSDMEPSLEIKDICKERKIDNYYVFDKELNARDMIQFIKEFDFGICMRFHACIFLKSLNVPVYGIDYTAGEIGKVGGLFNSLGDKNHSNILNLEPQRIVKFIEEIE